MDIIKVVENSKKDRTVLPTLIAASRLNGNGRTKEIICKIEIELLHLVTAKRYPMSVM